MRIGVHRRISEIPASAWNALVPEWAVFVRHELLAALEESGSISAELGWIPHHISVWSGNTLCAAAPCYIKLNSHGEFVFDWQWARVYQQLGLQYYPKLLVGVPYTPASAPRLLATGSDRRLQLADVLRDQCRSLQASSVHLNFLEADEFYQLCACGFTPRLDVQFHWHNAGYADFNDFLGRLSAKKRKNIRQERARAANCGLALRTLSGAAIGARELDAMHGFYIQSFAEKGNTPALTRGFFHQLHQAMPDALLLNLAYAGDEPVAGALFVRSKTRLYGRYWGAVVDVPALHFELCYYRAIEYAIAEGIALIEPGAQGEHKQARGFEPTLTRSAHWLRHPALNASFRDYAERERESISAYRAELMAHSAYAR